MSGEKQRHRWRRDPILIEENIIIDSKLTTITTRTEEQTHTKNTKRQWYNNDEDEKNQPIILSPTPPPPPPPLNETISEKIERVLRKINGWTNETSSTATNHNNNNIQREPLQDTSFNKTNSSAYDNICQGHQNESRFSKPISNSVFNSFRQRCCSSTYTDPNMVKNQKISTNRPYSMICVDDPLPPRSSRLTKDDNNYFREGQNRKVRGRNSILINEHD
jgi:hypothetical protein